MLSFGNNSPSLFLVETEKREKLVFQNTNTGVMHSIIDFYAEDLEGCYNIFKEKGIEVGPLNMHGSFGGFGFKDLDGNSFSITNALQEGQEFKESSKSVN